MKLSLCGVLALNHPLNRAAVETIRHRYVDGECLSRKKKVGGPPIGKIRLQMQSNSLVSPSIINDQNHRERLAYPQQEITAADHPGNHLFVGEQRQSFSCFHLKENDPSFDLASGTERARPGCTPPIGLLDHVSYHTQPFLGCRLGRDLGSQTGLARLIAIAYRQPAKRSVSCRMNPSHA